MDRSPTRQLVALDMSGARFWSITTVLSSLSWNFAPFTAESADTSSAPTTALTWFASARIVFFSASEAWSMRLW